MEEENEAAVVDTSAADDESDIITSHIETAVNLASHPEIADIELTLSSEILQFLHDEGEVPEEVISRRIIDVAETDDSLPLTHYFISTSHNTYLLGLQLFGSASATAYTHVLAHHCRCVEIDVWPPTDAGGEPVVTHGHTFSQHIPFRNVCAAIGDAVHPGAWPVMVSLECHLDVPDQDMIVRIMKDVWGPKIVERAVEGVEEGKVSPRDLRGRIILMVEYYPAQSVQEAQDEAVESDTDTGDDASAKKQPRIGESLAALGVYAHSVKPRKDWLVKDILSPPHILYNVSESTLSKLLPAALQSLVANSLTYLRRVYPKFLRITSSNLEPLMHWRSGTQVVALNWQHYDKSVQLNEAMFVGSEGWVLKPASLLRFTDATSRIHLTCDIVAGCNIPGSSPDQKAYVCTELFLASGVPTATSDDALPTSAGAYRWHKSFDWEYTSNEDSLAFIRISVYYSAFGKDARLGTFCARVAHLQPGWRLVRLFNRKGRHNGGVLLVRFATRRV